MIEEVVEDLVELLSLLFRLACTPVPFSTRGPLPLLLLSGVPFAEVEEVVVVVVVAAVGTAVRILAAFLVTVEAFTAAGAVADVEWVEDGIGLELAIARLMLMALAVVTTALIPTTL